MNAVRASVSVSDSLGNLLFYSNGISLWNRNHQIMPNGTNLHASSSDQTVSVIPKLDDDSSYYLFTMRNHWIDSLSVFNGLHYSVINMRLDGGFGDIEPGQKEIPLQTMFDVPALMTTARHQNNKDAWVILKMGYNANEYAAFLVNESGISTTPVSSPSTFPWNPLVMGNLGTMRVSPDGTKLVYPHHDTVEVCNFDALTGQVTPLFLYEVEEIGNSEWCYMEFSPDSKFLYRSSGDWSYTPAYIFQYDATLTDSAQFAQSAIIVGYRSRGVHLQRGRDGKIYGGETGKDSLSVIQNPNLQGTACNYEPHAISLNGSICHNGMPDLLQRYYVYINHDNPCQNTPVQFSSTIWTPADSIHWDFGDPASGAANYSNDSTPTHIYTLPGQYSVELFVRHIDNRTDTSWITITIYETPDPNLGPDKTICLGNSVVLDAGLCLGCVYEWGSIPPGFFSNEQTVTINQTGLYTVEVTSPNECRGRDTIQLSFVTPPIVTNNPLSKSICSGESTEIPLTSNISGTSFSWSAVGSSPSIIGFGPGTGDTIDQVLTNTGLISETVTYTIIPSLGDCEGDSVEYVIAVTPGDSVLVNITASNDSICEGSPITYTAISEHGGSAPNYQWKVNGINQGTNNSIFNYTPSNHDTVCCILTSSDTVCISNNPATSNEIIMTVFPDLPVLISMSTTNNPVCEGNTTIFTASTTNKGASPNFQWFVNGNSVGTNDSSYSYMPSNGDQISCILTSSEQCTSNNPATSDTITMIVNSLVPVGISIAVSENPVCEGLPVTFSSTPINGGSSPTFQWQVNGVNTGTNNSDFTYPPVDGDLVKCTLTSNAECVTNNPAESNTISMSVGDAPNVSFSICFDTITTLNAKPFKLKGGVPLGGTYSGPGVDQITGFFNPAMAGVGLKTISYSYTNLFNCSNNATRAISVINPAPFSCGDSLTDIRDNKKYPTIQIGSQCWLAVNLNHGQQINVLSAQRDNCLVEKYCYNDLPANCNQYGALYQWDELMRFEDAEEIQGLCPPGWHVPSETDWIILFTNWFNNAFAGKPLLYTGYSGFNVLLAGVEFFNQSNRFVDFASIMWSSTSHGPYKAWSHGLNEYNYSVSYYSSYRSNAFSVRCVRD